MAKVKVEAVEAIKNLRLFMQIEDSKNPDCKFMQESYDSLDMAIKSLEKQIPQRPVEDPFEEGILFTRYKCPLCGCRRLGHGFDLDKCHCPECGQKLDWSETPW